MKKSLLSLIAMLIVSSYSLKAQNLIAVQHGSDATFYTNLDTAISNAPSGSTVYIPGGNYSIGQITISKELHIIGVGHNPDSTISTFPTTINGNINFQAGASNGSLTGISFNGNIATESMYSFTIKRCHIIGTITLNQSDSNFIFIENIFEGEIRGENSTYFSFINNIIGSYFYSPFINSIFMNNIFFYNTGWDYHGWAWVNASPKTQNSLIENNIFIGNTGDFSGISNSIAKNNLFTEAITFPNGTNVGSFNIIRSQYSIFVNYSGNGYLSHPDNYHLTPSCQGINAGTDGTDIGIYGGASPWKDGSVPSNPHVINSYIGGATNNNGTLPVNIKVEAQGN